MAEELLRWCWPLIPLRPGKTGIGFRASGDVMFDRRPREYENIQLPAATLPRPGNTVRLLYREVYGRFEYRSYYVTTEADLRTCQDLFPDSEPGDAPWLQVEAELVAAGCSASELRTDTALTLLNRLKASRRQADKHNSWATFLEGLFGKLRNFGNCLPKLEPNQPERARLRAGEEFRRLADDVLDYLRESGERCPAPSGMESLPEFLGDLNKQLEDGKQLTSDQLDHAKRQLGGSANRLREILGRKSKSIVISVKARSPWQIPDSDCITRSEPETDAEYQSGLVGEFENARPWNGLEQLPDTQRQRTKGMKPAKEQSTAKSMKRPMVEKYVASLRSRPGFVEGDADQWADAIAKQCSEDHGENWKCSATMVKTLDVWDDEMKSQGRSRKKRSVAAGWFSPKVDAIVGEASDLTDQLFADEEQPAIDAIMASGMNDESKAVLIKEVRDGSKSPSAAIQIARTLRPKPKGKAKSKPR